MRIKNYIVRKFIFSKKMALSVLCGIIFSAASFAESAFLFSAYPHFTLPLGNETHNITYGIGGGAKLSFRPLRFFEFGVYGDYYNYSIEKIDPISVFDAGLAAAYVLPVGDRFSLNFGLNVGMYKAVRDTSLNGLEAGVGISFAYKARPAISFGAGTSLTHFAAGNTALINGLSFSPQVTFNLTEAFASKTKIKMEPQEILPVFPVLYSWYENNSFGTVKITNEESSAIENIKVSFYQPQYMGHPNVCFDSENTKLKKIDMGGSVDVELTAFFNERMLEMTEKTDTQAFVTVEYTCLGKKKSKEFPMIIPVYGRNSMSWSDDRRAAVFVSSKDPAAMLYSKYVSSIVRENMRIGVPTNIQYAMGIFDSLAAFGINYVIDPSSAYTDNVGTETPDFLQFPYQTLSYRGGDCDDLSILVCSLFEAVGIETAFITIPGHIYMAFNSGLDVSKAKEQFGALDNFIVLENEVWVPLEITLTDEGFNKAWRVGMREWRIAEREGSAAIYRMRDSWQTYKPVSVQGASTNFTMPEKTEIASAFEKGIDEWILREIGPKVEAYKTYIARTGDLGAQNDLGALYGRYGISDLASAQLKTPAKKGHISAMLNTANVYYTRKEYAKAKKQYKSVLKREPSNGLAYLGIARCCYELEEYSECDLAYQKARELNEELAGTYAYLGAFESTVGRAFNLADRLAYTVWPTEGNTGYKDVIDAVAEKKNEELLALYGDAAKETIEKEKAAASFAKEREMEQYAFEERDDHPYVGLPNEISIMTQEGMLALKQLPEQEEEKEEIPVVMELPKEVVELPPEKPKTAKKKKPKAKVVEPPPVETMPALVVSPPELLTIVEEPKEIPATMELPSEKDNMIGRGHLDVPKPPTKPRPPVVAKPKPEAAVMEVQPKVVESPKVVEKPKAAEKPNVAKTTPKKTAAPKLERIYDEFPGDKEPVKKSAVAKAPVLERIYDEFPDDKRKPVPERIYDEFPGDKKSPKVVKTPPKKAAPVLERIYDEFPDDKELLVQKTKVAEKPVQKPKAAPLPKPVEKPVPKSQPKPVPQKKPVPKSVAPHVKPQPKPPVVAQQKTVAKTQTVAPPQPAPKYPSLVAKGYYVQIGTFGSEEKIARVYEKYSRIYPVVVTEKGSKKVMLVGPLSVDEYGIVLERFKAYGFTDAFVKSIM